MQSVQLHEHLSEPMSEVLSVLGRDYDYPQLTKATMREFTNKTFNAQDTKTPRSFSKFLLRLTTKVPRLILTQFPLIENYIDSEPYTTRMALVEMVGLFIKQVADDELFKKERKAKQLNSLFSSLIAYFELANMAGAYIQSINAIHIHICFIGALRVLPVARLFP
ncbi:Condensin complex subunit 1 OS=Saccharomyces cerevisiae (strain ATCC 204508 / S288c) GN=YCS4 PE=1 SV=1 [Rhizoctonia solani AG-1 IB]|uniref:Condensin complex subunit 1 n=1 Tax=Thanatephorus cucumeris (strain AG1-IB / isolate 7/3/14) TaxID=1108050 RepID=A0A0B7FBV4_THACB|nr:Condensin complex subunit 1 OS=Saccharomyces cerevisiae (strain ATCC 204508 / S288c) GN=YCS4 PE=1 SV=1 [Rhizoctonia solani AG-1 IB]